MRLLMSVVKVVATLSVLFALSGAAYQWYAESTDDTLFPPPGERYLVDGLEMHLDCRGNGSPVVLLEAGLGSGSSSWRLIHDELSELTQVCAYDRAGMDWSEQSDAPVTAPSVANRLLRLLEVAEVEGPRILVGMSAGGVFVREFYARYPQQVMGMVLVDSSHEQQGSRLPSLGDNQTLSYLLTACSFLQPLGVVRIFNLMDVYLDQYAVPEGVRKRARAIANKTHACASMQTESEGFATEVYDAQPPGSLGDLPLIVLSQGKPPEENKALGMTLAQAEELAVVWDELQEELTALSTKGQRRIATESGHVIQLEQPQIVIDAISYMVRELR